jgi:hypothetical protein
MNNLINAAKIKGGALLISTSLITLTIGSLRIDKTSQATDWGGTTFSFSTIAVSVACFTWLGGIIILIEGCFGRSFISLCKQLTCSPPFSNVTERPSADSQQSAIGDIQPSEQVVPPNEP